MKGDRNRIKKGKAAVCSVELANNTPNYVLGKNQPSHEHWNKD
jgi:hypothetical protein